MTRRRLTALLVGAAGAVAAAGLLARPLLVGGVDARTPAAATARTATAGAPAAVLDIGRRAATRATCTAAHRSCSPVTVERVQGYCSTPDRCLVELLTIRTAAGMTVPVALTVTVTRDTDGGWHLLEVTS